MHIRTFNGNYSMLCKHIWGRQRTRCADCIEKGIKPTWLKLEGKPTGRGKKTLKELEMAREQWKGLVSESITGSSWRGQLTTWCCICLCKITIVMHCQTTFRQNKTNHHYLINITY